MIHCKSYAKLNLFLNIINKRDDGYHNLQSMMQIIDFHDDLSFERRRDNKIVLQTNNQQLRKENIMQFKIYRQCIDNTSTKKCATTEQLGMASCERNEI